MNDRRRGPVRTAVLRARQQDLVIPQSGALLDALVVVGRALPDGVKLAATRIDSHFLEAVADTQQLAGVRVVHTETVEWRDYLWSGPGHASIRRLHKRYGLGGACSPEGRVGRRDQVCEVVERVGLGAGVDEDDIADRLLPLPRVDDDLGRGPVRTAIHRH